MLNINNVMFTGRLTRDPETKNLSGGVTVTNFSVAINNPRKVNGEWQSETVFMDVSAFDKTAERAAELSKGDSVYVEGKLKQDSWEKDGVKQSKIKVQASVVKAFKEPETGTSGRSERVNAETYTQETGGPSDGLHFGSTVSDDVPF